MKYLCENFLYKQVNSESSCFSTHEMHIVYILTLVICIMRANYYIRSEWSGYLSNILSFLSKDCQQMNVIRVKEKNKFVINRIHRIKLKSIKSFEFNIQTNFDYVLHYNYWLVQIFDCIKVTSIRFFYYFSIFVLCNSWNCMV